MEEKNTKYLFDDRELDDEECINESELKLIVDEETAKELDKTIQEILNSIKIEYDE